MLSGCFTAIITPFQNGAVDAAGLDSLVDFQIENGISGILAAGTTGESPVLSSDEHHQLIESVAAKTKGKCSCIAGTGSNNTQKTLKDSKHAAEVGADALLLVDPYYNGPSSLEIRREYVAPVARNFPDMQIIPYVIPGRTGAQLLPEDLALLFKEFKNVGTVKEATGNIENMKRTRACCGPDYTILSGDDGMTFDMMTDSQISASGVISVISNVAPGPVTQLAKLLAAGETSGARALLDALTPLFGLVTVTTQEETEFGPVVCRARNPLAVKALMSILGMPSGECRQPLGKMTRNGIETVLSAARAVRSANPEILAPVSDFFNVDIDERLDTPAVWEDLYYPDY